jgi:hypothetical protein
MWKPATRIHVQADIAAPADFAFDFFANNESVWLRALPELTSVEVEPPGHLATGTLLVFHASIMGSHHEFELLVTECTPPTSISFEGVNQGILIVETRRFAVASSHRTTLDNTVAYTPRTLGGWANYLLFYWWVQPLIGKHRSRKVLKTVAADCEAAYQAASARGA